MRSRSSKSQSTAGGEVSVEGFGRSEGGARLKRPFTAILRCETH